MRLRACGDIEYEEPFGRNLGAATEGSMRRLTAASDRTAPKNRGPQLSRDVGRNRNTLASASLPDLVSHELEAEMRNTLSRTMIAGVAALSLTTSLFATTEPASAAFRLGGGGGGFHGGGFHGGGAWRGGGWRGGYGGWGGGYGGWGGGGWWGPAVVGGLAAGALLAAPYYGYGYGGGCLTYTPVYDAYGNYIGQQAARIC